MASRFGVASFKTNSTRCCGTIGQAFCLWCVCARALTGACTGRHMCYYSPAIIVSDICCCFMHTPLSQALYLALKSCVGGATSLLKFFLMQYITAHLAGQRWTRHQRITSKG